MSNNNINHWEGLDYNELKIAIEHAIMGQGMGGSTQYLHFIPDYLDNISNQKLINEVIKIIIEIAEDFENPTSSRAIYLLGEFPIPNKDLKFIEMTMRLDPILDNLIDSKEIPESCMKYLAYICELNKIIGKLHISNAKPFLEKQVKLLQKPIPQPNSNAHYLYYFSAKSAEVSLNLLKAQA